MDSIFDYKKPFPDIDIALFYKKNDKKNSLAMFKWDYTYMNKIKKIGDNKFRIISEESSEGTILFK